MDNKESKPKNFRNFYGRLKGKGLRALQQKLLNDQLEKLSIPAVKYEINPDRKLIELSDLFKNVTSFSLEIGFGGGEHLVYQAERNPNIGFIGCEPYINGVAMLAGKLSKLELTNVRIHPGDVRDLFDVLPDDSIDNVFLLYPDPWPKKKTSSAKVCNKRIFDRSAASNENWCIIKVGYRYSRLCSTIASRSLQASFFMDGD